MRRNVDLAILIVAGLLSAKLAIGPRDRVAEWGKSADRLVATLQSGAGRRQGQIEPAVIVGKSEDVRTASLALTPVAYAMLAQESPSLVKGEARVMDLYRFVVIAAAGAVLLCLLFFRGLLKQVRRNIPGEKAASALVHCERERLRVTLASIQDAVIETDRKGRITFLNPVAETLTKWTLGEAVGRPIADVVHIVSGPPRESDLSLVARALGEEAAAGLEDHAVLVDRDGGEKPIANSESPLKDERDHVTGAVHVIRDVSEQRRLDQVIRERDDYIRQLLNSMAEGVYGIDLDGRCTFCNPACLRMLGYQRPEEVIGKDLEKLLRRAQAGGAPLPKSRREIHAPLGTADDAHVAEDRFWRADGSPIAVEYWSYPMRSGGKLVGSAITFVDVSDRMSAEKSRTERSRMTSLRADVFTSLAKLGDQNHVLLECMQAIVRRTSASAAQVWMTDDAQFAAKLQAGAGLTMHDGEGLDGPAEAPSPKHRAASRQTSLFGAFVADSRLGGVSFGDQADATVFNAFSMEIEGEAIGVLGTYSKEELPRREAEELASLAEQIAQFLVRRRALVALAENERQLRQWADSIPQLAWMAGPDGQAFWYNQRWFDFTGTTPEQMEEDGWQSVHDPVEFPRVMEKFRHCLRTGEPWEETFPLKRHDGVYRWHLSLMLPIRDREGRVVRWFGTHTDITERREAEAAIRESEGRYRDLAEAMPQIVWVTKPDGAIEYYNQRWYDFTGCTAEEDINEAWSSRLHPDERVRALSGWHKSLQTGKPYEIEYRLRSDEGDYRWFLRRALPIRDSAGKITRWVGTSTDIHDRKKTEEERERLSFLVESSREFIGICDLQGRPLFVNAAGLKLVGLGSADAIKKTTLRDYFFPDDLPFVFDEFLPQVLDQGAAETEIRFRHFGTGEAIWMAYSVVVMRDGVGQPSGFATVSRDVTDRRKDREKLAASQQFLRSALNALSSHIAVLDERGVILTVNDAWRSFANSVDSPMEQTGLGQNYLVACSQAAARGDEHARIVETSIRQVIDGVVPSHVFEYPRHTAAEQRWFQLRITRFAGTAPARVVVAHEDITSRILSEQATLKRTEQLRALADAALKVSLEDDAQAILKQTAEAARKIIGASYAVSIQVAGENWGDAKTASSLADQYQIVPGVEAKLVDWRICRQVCDRNQSIRLGRDALFDSASDNRTDEKSLTTRSRGGVLAAPLIGFNGRNIGAVQVSEKDRGEFTPDDESVLVQLAQMASVALENVRLYDELKNADLRKDEFLATLAHELRNPLAPLAASLQLISLERQNPVEIGEYVDLATRQCDQLTRLIDDLLDISRISTGKFRLQREPIELQTAIETALEMAGPSIASGGHELRSTIPPAPIYVCGDRVRLAQIFANLLINAAKYTPRGGVIELSVSSRDGQAELAVRDTGIGIPDDKIGGIFELFSQIDNSPTRTQGGLGIGLTLVRTLVGLHEGSVTGFSEGEGKGSTFTVRLPTQRDGQRPPKPDAKVTQPEPPRYRILIVDDNRTAGLLLSRLLGKLGQTAEVVDDPHLAIERAKEFRPQVVFSDIAMPGMSGYELAAAFKKLPLDSPPILVALTGYGQASDRQAAFEAGFSEHLVKPVGLDMLRKLLKRLPELASASVVEESEQ